MSQNPCKDASITLSLLLILILLPMTLIATSILVPAGLNTLKENTLMGIALLLSLTPFYFLLAISIGWLVISITCIKKSKS